MAREARLALRLADRVAIDEAPDVEARIEHEQCVACLTRLVLVPRDP
jgi:hypothetical protein